MTTYVNSGNLVLVPAAGSDVAAGLSAAFADEFGFDIPVIARTLEEWDAVVEAVPLPTEDPTHLVAVFWDGPVAATAKDFDPSRYGRETVAWAEARDVRLLPRRAGPLEADAGRAVPRPPAASARHATGTPSSRCRSSPANASSVASMATLFTKIIDGDIPARFVWADEVAVAFGTIAPITDGHVLVVPRAEILQLTDAPDDVLSHLMLVARTIGQAQQRSWDAPRAALLVAGFEVPHLHLHVLPAWDEASLTFANARPTCPPPSSTPPPSGSGPPWSSSGHGAHVPASLGVPEPVSS